MSTGAIILLGAVAGLTIYLGLPLTFLRKSSPSLKVFFSMLATGVLIFLLYDIIAHAGEPITQLIAQVRTNGTGSGLLFMNILLLFLGIGLGLIGLVYVSKILGKYAAVKPATRPLDVSPSHVQVRAATPSPGVLGSIEARELSASASTAGRGATAVAVPVAPAPASRELAPQTVALIIAIGIGLHNFSEGLAIGQSASTGAMQLAVLLIVGFGLHNMTEGFGIAGPLTGQAVSWRFIALMGLIAGGPTFLGTIVGTTFQSQQAYIFCLALAAGAIMYVVAELFGVVKRFRAPEVAMWGVLVGFILGYATDLLVGFAGG
ncbi:MAG: ZIP family metal transporter [Ktedonobacteraceae bacterium]